MRRQDAYAPYIASQARRLHTLLIIAGMTPAYPVKHRGRNACALLFVQSMDSFMIKITI